MNDAEEREAFFKQRSYTERVKFARRTATVMGTLSIVTLIAIVFGFFQKEAVERRDVQLKQCSEEVTEYRNRAEKAELELLGAKQMLEDALNAAHEAQRYAEEQYGKAWEQETKSTKRK